MNLDLYRQVTIDIIDVYAVLFVKRKSPDLQDYLCKELSVPEIDRYLKSIEVYDKSRNLTKLGKQLKEKGEIFQSEEGKYRFYLISNDPMLKTKLLYFKRQKPEAGQKSLNQNPYKELEINQAP